MTVQVRYFASLREALGASEAVVCDAGQHAGPAARPADRPRRRACPGAGTWTRLRCALNQVMADEATPVPDGAEVAFFPPVTGG
jgi:molybdopterin synthase sulfur carrier subunit